VHEEDEYKYNPDSNGEKPKRSFLQFLFNWWVIIGTGSCVVISIAYTVIMQKALGIDDFKLISWTSLVLAIALLISSIVFWFWMRKKLYGIKWGEGGQEVRDIYPKQEKEKKNFAKLKSDTASDERIKKIGKKYKKLPPPEE
jgi:hypothetical protein